jgi:hypothetical protein
LVDTCTFTLLGDDGSVVHLSVVGDMYMAGTATPSNRQESSGDLKKFSPLTITTVSPSSGPEGG